MLFIFQKSSTAWGYITAHMTRIHDIDWSYVDHSQLTTCSHDSSVKFWDTSSPRKPLSVIKTGSQPVWRARNYVCMYVCMYVRLCKLCYNIHFVLCFTAGYNTLGLSLLESCIYFVAGFESPSQQSVIASHC